ncbi:hypothetical protein [Micromonospora sp. NPDC048830]|uniref:hypothetical protein n=1 Tax=Micromonospora sp. NPDC048830 TaxID=3364257 RepID=UPI00371840FA
MPAGAASRADDTPIHHNANANANDRDSDSASDTSVSSDGIFSNLDTSDTISISDVSLPDEPVSGASGKGGFSDTDSLRNVSSPDESFSGDPGTHREPVVTATGQAVGAIESAQQVTAADQTLARPVSSGDRLWCVPATLDAFKDVYGRWGNRGVFDDRFIGPDRRFAAKIGWPQLLEILDVVPERVAPHPDGVAGEDVLAALRAVPGSMVVVRAAPPNEPQHVFALHNEPQKSGPPKIKVRDTLARDPFDPPKPNDPIRDPWLRHLFMSSTRVAAFDGDGQPATITDLLPDHTTGHPQPITTTGTDPSALLLASTSTPRSPSQAMQADTTSPDPADSPRQPSEPAENDEPAGTGLASIGQAFRNVVDPDPDRVDLDTPMLDKDWEPPGGTEQVESDLLAEANRVRADEDARRQEDEQQRADPHSADDEHERVETERRDAENAERRAETWRQAEPRDGVDAAAGAADRTRLEQTVIRHQERLDGAANAALDAGTAWERAVGERDQADATRAAVKGDAGEPDPARPRSFADGAIGELSVSAVQQLRPQEVTDTVTQLMHLVGVTEGVTARDDLGVIATSAEEVPGMSGASLAADASALGRTHVATDPSGKEETGDKTTGAFPFGGESERESALEVDGKVLNHTVLNHKEDPQEQTGQQTQAVASGGALTEHHREADDLVRQEVESQLTAARQIEPQPVVSQINESAQALGPDPAHGGMTEAVRQYGSQLDGMQGLEHVMPVPESVVEWLREQVKAAAGARGTQAAFGTQLDRRLTARYLFAEWPRVRSESGLPLSIPADGGQTPWLRVVLGDAAAADPGIEQLRDGPPVAFQRWAFGGWEVAETATASDLRSMNLPFSYSHKWPVENLGKLRRAVLTVQPTITYNQMSTSVRVTGGVQALTILRSRERSWPYMYQMRWQMRVGDDVSRPWIDLPPPAERLPVWFPKHVVEIPPENTEQPRPARLDTLRNDIPLFGVQSVPNADRILSDVMASFRPQLTSLSKESRDDLQEFFGEYSLRGDIPLMWVGIQPSPLLFAEDGSVIGYLRVRADLYERGVAGPATQNAVLESHVLRILRVEGSAKVTNAVGVDGSVSFGMSRAPADPVTGVEPTGGTVRGQLGARHQVSHTLGSGGGARTSHSLRTSKPLIPLAADVIFDMELVRADGAVVRPEPSTPLGWSGAPYLVILRVPPADTVTKPTTPRYLPLEIAQLRSLGVSTTPLRVTGAEPLFASAETWLRERGFLPPDGDPSLADRLTDEATRIQRLENVRKLDLARSGMGLRGAADELIEGGYPIVFELPVRGEIQRVEVRLSADRRFADEPEGGVSHNLFLPDIQTLNWTGSTLPASEKRARSPFGWSAGIAGSYSNPLDLGDQSRPLQSISSGVNRSSRPATITETSIGFGQELYALSPSADGSHTFMVPVALRMEISWSYGPVPEPSIVDGMFALAVPTYRTLTQSVEISPYQMPAPREVTHQDRASLNQPDGDAVYQNGVLRLPESALVDRVEGSRSIRAVVSDLIGAVRRAAAAAERSAASSNVMPGTFPVDDAAVPPQVAGDIEMQMQTAESPPDSAETNSRVPHGEAGEDRTPAMPGAFPPDEATGPVQARGNEPVADDQTVAPSGGAGRTASWFGGLVVGGWTWAKRRVIGESLSRPESMGQEVAHAAMSPHHLAANALQVFDNQYVSENIGEHGMVWGTDVSVTVEGYLTDVEPLPPPGTMDMEIWLQSFDGSSQTAESSVLYEVPTAVTGTYGSDTQFVPSGTYTYGTREDAHTTFSDNTMAFRVTTENDVSMFRFKARAIYIVTVTKGSRNVVAGTLSGSPFFEKQLAVELPEAVEFLLTENDLFNYPELRQIPGVPQADPERPAEPADRMLPHWFVRSGGELGFGVATAVIARGSRPQFREGIRALVEAQVPGVTRPGHSAYVPGILSRIADHSSPLALRSLINAGPKGRATFHFVHRWSWLGPRLVEVEISAQPAQTAAQLAGLRGRKTSTTAGLDVILAHSSGEGGSLQIAGASRQSVTRATGNKVAFSPLAKREEHQSQSPLAIATQHSRTNAASSLREYRTWQRTLATTQFDRVPYTLGVTARSMPLSDALIVAVGRAAINGLLAVGRLVRLAWQDLPRVSATSESYLAFPALVTLRFSEAETPRDPIVEQERVEPAMFTSDPTLVVPPPTDTVAVDMEVPAEIRALVAGAPWRPSRAFSVYDFDAVAQLAEAIRTVDPSLAGDDQLHNSVSAEGIFLRLAQLARSGKVTMLEPAAVGRLLGRAGTPGTSLQFALYTPGSTSTSRNVAIDSVYANTDTFATIVNSSVIPTFGFSHTAPFTHDGNNYGGPMVPIAGVEAAQDQSAGGFGQRREIIRFGTPIESADGNGTSGYQLTAVAVIRVGGPKGTRWVVGNIEIRTTEAPAGAENLALAR